MAFRMLSISSDFTPAFSFFRCTPMVTRVKMPPPAMKVSSDVMIVVQSIVR